MSLIKRNLIKLMYRVVTKKIERVTNRWMNDDTAGVKIPESLIFIKSCIQKKIVNISPKGSCPFSEHTTVNTLVMNGIRPSFRR